MFGSFALADDNPAPYTISDINLFYGSMITQVSNLLNFENPSGGVLAFFDANGNVNVPSVENTAAQTTLTGSAGTAICSQPEQGSSYKKVVVYLSGYTDTGTQVFTYPTAFSNTPYVYGLTAGVSGATATTTTVTFTVATQTGFVFLEGY
jgi:hypothetical protein